MSLLDRIVQFHLDRPDGPLVGTTVSRKQPYISKLMDKLAAKYVGREVHAVYPPDYKP